MCRRMRISCCKKFEMPEWVGKTKRFPAHFSCGNMEGLLPAGVAGDKLFDIAVLVDDGRYIIVSGQCMAEQIALFWGGEQIVDADVERSRLNAACIIWGDNKK